VFGVGVKATMKVKFGKIGCRRSLWIASVCGWHSFCVADGLAQQLFDFPF
jgi:hypothetical protein